MKKIQKQEQLCGVPEGSILGSLLFLLCVNDLKNGSKQSTHFFFFLTKGKIFRCVSVM